jgi:hypothetical protein
MVAVLGPFEALPYYIHTYIDTNRKNDYEALKEIQTKMKDTMESQIAFLVSRMEAERKTDWEEIKAAIQSIQSELDQTIQQRV